MNRMLQKNLFATASCGIWQTSPWNFETFAMENCGCYWLVYCLDSLSEGLKLDVVVVQQESVSTDLEMRHRHRMLPGDKQMLQLSCLVSASDSVSVTHHQWHQWYFVYSD